MTYSPSYEWLVPLALQDLTSLFGMGRGVAPALKSPANFFLVIKADKRKADEKGKKEGFRQKMI